MLIFFPVVKLDFFIYLFFNTVLSYLCLVCLGIRSEALSLHATMAGEQFLFYIKMTKTLQDILPQNFNMTWKNIF